MKEGHRANICSKVGEANRWIQRIRTHQSRKPVRRNLCRNQCPDRKTGTVTDKLLEAQCAQV